MSFSGIGEIATIPSTINAHVYIENLNKFLILLIGNCFGDNKVLFMEDRYLVAGKVV